MRDMYEQESNKQHTTVHNLLAPYKCEFKARARNERKESDTIQRISSRTMEPSRAWKVRVKEKGMDRVKIELSVR